MVETRIYKEELNRLFRVIKPNYQGENLNVSLSIFEDSWLKITRMQIYISDFVVCAKKQKLRRCKKHKKYNTHTKNIF